MPSTNRGHCPGGSGCVGTDALDGAEICGIRTSASPLCFSAGPPASRSSAETGDAVYAMADPENVESGLPEHARGANSDSAANNIPIRPALRTRIRQSASHILVPRDTERPTVSRPRFEYSRRRNPCANYAGPTHVASVSSIIKGSVRTRRNIVMRSHVSL